MMENQRVDETLDDIERRISALERQILPKDHMKSEDEVSICVILHQTQDMVDVALKGRDTIISMLNRLPELNELLDPTYTVNFDAELQKQYLLLMYPLYKDTAAEVQKYLELRHNEETKHLDVVLELTDKLQTLLYSNSELYEECNGITRKIIKCLQDNHNITNTLTTLFAQLDLSVCEIETQLNPKKIVEE